MRVRVFRAFTAPLLVLVSSGVCADQRIIVNDAWITEAAPGVNIVAGYMLIENTTNSDVFLTDISSESFKRIEMHRSVKKGDTVSMQRQTNLGIPAKGKLALTPGDYHLMLFEPKTRPQTGDQLPLELLFSDKTIIRINAIVKRAGDTRHGHHH